MTDKTQDPSQQLSARRRLLRGAISVPTVLTLSSGSALAASSSLVCASKLPNGVEVGKADNFFRVQRFTATRTGRGQQSVTRLLVKGRDIRDLATVNGFQAGTIGSFEWINVTDSSNATAFVNESPAITPTAETDKFVALRFTNTGTETSPIFTVTGLSDAAQPGSGTGKVMTSSCWSSFTPSAQAR